MQGVRDYLKYLKRGYSRVTQMTALDRRRGKMDKVRAEELIDRWEGKRPPSLSLFLEYIGITEAEFNTMVEKLAVSPHNPNFENIENGPKTPDYENWYREV